MDSFVPDYRRNQLSHPWKRTPLLLPLTPPKAVRHRQTSTFLRTPITFPFPTHRQPGRAFGHRPFRLRLRASQHQRLPLLLRHRPLRLLRLLPTRLHRPRMCTILCSLRRRHPLPIRPHPQHPQHHQFPLPHPLTPRHRLLLPLPLRPQGQHRMLPLPTCSRCWASTRSTR